LNINKNLPIGGSDVLLQPTEGSQWFGPNGEINRTLPSNNLLAVNNAFNDNRPKSVNPFIIGVKGTIFFDVTKPPKEKPVKEVKPIPPPPPRPLLITGKIINVETAEEVTTATVEMFDMDKNGAKVFTAKPQYGIFNTKLDRKGTYKVNVTAPNFNAYSETFSNVGDTLMVYIEPIAVGQSFIIKNIFFEFDKTALISTSNQSLDELAEFLKENSAISIKVVGHTDNKGSDAYNQRLSEGRAKAVVDALIARGIEIERLASEGRAARQPICPANDTEECRAENRRVEFEITDVK
jgi:outer membrane protein OmpA-like peptidoglycan-associated protein